MTVTSPSPFEHRVERFLSSLAGVVSVRVLAGGEGRVQEIHVLSTPRLHPKQVVRNVESALSAGMGMEIDRRIVSVAQVRSDAEPGALEETPADAPDRAEEPAPERLVFVRYDARSQVLHDAHCRVVLRGPDDEFTGSGEGPNTVQGRSQAAARALFSALAAARGLDDAALEGTAVVETHGHSYVLIAARGIDGRQTVPLTGCAPLSRSPEEAAILASLQATNRWAELPT